MKKMRGYGHHRGMNYQIAEIMRLIQNMICIGTITDVDHAKALVRVDVNGRKTTWLPVPGIVGNNLRATNHLRTGTQVALAAPSGDPANAIILTVLFSNALPTASTNGAIDTVQWDDGTAVTYDTSNKRLTLHSVGDLVISADGAIGIQANGDLWLDAAHIHSLEGGI